MHKSSARCEVPSYSECAREELAERIWTLGFHTKERTIESTSQLPQSRLSVTGSLTPRLHLIRLRMTPPNEPGGGRD